MEQDKQLREILLNSAERASADFTGAVMNKVNKLTARSLYYQPLVSPKLTRLFIFTFGALITAILGLCSISALTNIHVLSWLQSIKFFDLNYNRILIFILMFWIVFSVYTLLEKKLFPS